MHYKKYLKEVENISLTDLNKKSLVWPNTPIDCDKIQNAISKWCNAKDYDLDKPGCRTMIIKRILDDLYLKKDFSILDIACGDAVILKYIKQFYLEAKVFGFDINVGNFATHESIISEGVYLSKGTIQNLFKKETQERFDVVMMLNTFRDWKAAQLKPHDSGLPLLAENWIFNNSNYAILTLTNKQINRYKEMGKSVFLFEKGESDTKFVLLKNHE